MLQSALKFTGLVVVILAGLGGGLDSAAPPPDPPPASRSGGEPLRLSGSADLTREQLAEFIQSYRGPDPADFEPTDGEEHTDDEGASQTAALLASSLTGSSGASGLESPNPTTSWKALDAAGGVAADVQIAVSTTHVVVTNRTTAAFYDKAGTLVGTVPATMLYSPLGLNASSFWPSPINEYFDMRAIFDPHRKRFWIVTLGDAKGWKTFVPALIRHVTAVAVSKTENPLDGWYLYWSDAVSHFGQNDDVYQAGDFSDYPTLGVDTALFHETHAVNNFDLLHTKTFRYQQVSFCGANQMAAGMPAANVPCWHYWDLQLPDGSPATKTIQAVVHHTASTRSFYVSRAGGSTLVVWSLTNPFQATQKISATNVTVPYPWIGPLDAPQPSGSGGQLIKMTNLGTNALKAVFRDGLLHVVTNDAIYPFTAVRYVRMLTNTYPAIFTDSVHKFVSRTFGVFDAVGGSFAYAAWPAVEVNKAGNAAIVFARSAADVNAEVRFSTYFADESDIRLSRLLKIGETTYQDGINTDPGDVLPWGDTAGASVDPKDDGGIWIAQQYAKATGKIPNYAIWVGKVFGKTYFDLLFNGITVESADLSTHTLVVSGQVHNGGDGSAPSGQLSFVLLNGTRSSVPLGTVPQPALKPGDNADFRTTFTLPVDLAPGSYQLKATLTTSASRDEYSDRNNTTVIPVTIR